MGEQRLLRLAYASVSVSRDRGGGTAIDPEIARILRACKHNNPRREVGGVLHYGHGFFFQVLEGPAEGVNAVYAQIAADPRHERVQTLDRRRAEQRRFPDWSMKYVPMDTEIEPVLKRHRLTTFDPYRFDARMIDDLIDVLVGAQAGETASASHGKKGLLQRLFGRR